MEGAVGSQSESAPGSWQRSAVPRTTAPTKPTFHCMSGRPSACRSSRSRFRDQLGVQVATTIPNITRTAVVALRAPAAPLGRFRSS
jgi:hypothetical protein